jgi:O-methyltransferase
VGVSEHWHPTQGGQWLAVSSSEVVTNIARFNLAVNIHIVEGYFSTLKTRLDLPEKISVLHLDGDMYASTYEALEALYPRLSIGGFVVEDDFYNPGFATSQQACDDYLSQHSIEEEIHRIPGEHSFGAYWRKTKEERRGH